MEATCWPEQEAVLLWLERYGIKKHDGAVRELIEAVTQPRLEETRKLERLRHLWLCEDYPERDRDIEEALGLRPGRTGPQEESDRPWLG